MWDKIKKALAWIAGGLITVLFFVLGLKNRKIKKTEEQLESAEEEIEITKEVNQKEEALEEVSQAIELNTEDRISEVRAETLEMLSEEVEMEYSGLRYNEIIEDWNNEGT